MIYVIIGRRKQGKSTLADFLASRTPGIAVRFDPRGLFDRSDAIELTKVSEARRLTEIITKHEIRSIVMTPGPTENLQQCYNTMSESLAALVQERPDYHLVYVIDEARFIPDLLTPSFEWLLRCADPDRVHVVLTCHRPQDVPTDIRAIVDYWMLFRMTQEHDLRVVAEKSPRAAVLVQKLDARQFVCWDDATGTLSEYRDPKAWYRPLRHGQASAAMKLHGDGATATVIEVTPMSGQREMF